MRKEKREKVQELIDKYNFKPNALAKGLAATKTMTIGIMAAVIAINDFSAIGVMKSIEEHGYRIPEDISVVSYDNTYMAQIATPRLTSIDYNYEEYGKKLIDTTIAMINGEKRDTLRMVTPTLVIRESSAKVRN